MNGNAIHLTAAIPRSHIRRVVSHIMESGAYRQLRSTSFGTRPGPCTAVAIARQISGSSGGNQCAAEMVSYFSSALTRTDAAAISFNLRNLGPTWGDTIGGLAWVLRNKLRGFPPLGDSGQRSDGSRPGAVGWPQYSVGVVGSKDVCVSVR